jgi:hypothetical protein
MMSSVDRRLSGDVLVLDLGEERRRLESAATDEGTRGARTLLKEGPLRVTLVVLAPGGSIAEHQAQGPITVQPLKGELRFAAGGSEYDPVRASSSAWRVAFATRCHRRRGRSSC